METRIVQILDELRAIGAYPVAVETDNDQFDIKFTGADVTSALLNTIKKQNDFYFIKIWVLDPSMSTLFPSQLITFLSTGTTINVPVQVIRDDLVSPSYHAKQHEI